MDISHSHYSFSDFILQYDGILLRNGVQISIAPKELGVLRVLVESMGKVVTKLELLDKVWQDTTVSEESLTRCICVLRRILGEDKTRRFIKTIYGKGYFFLPHVSVNHIENHTNISNQPVVAPKTPEDTINNNSFLDTLITNVLSHAQQNGWSTSLISDNNVSVNTQCLDKAKILMRIEVFSFSE